MIPGPSVLNMTWYHVAQNVYICGIVWDIQGLLIVIGITIRLVVNVFDSLTSELDEPITTFYFTRSQTADIYSLDF